MNLENDQELIAEQLELKRCIARLSFVGMGLSDDLDIALKALRQNIKSDANGELIKQKVDDISKILRAIEDHQHQSGVDTASVGTDSFDLTKDKRLPGALREMLASAKADIQSDKVVPIARNMVETILDYLQNNGKIGTSQQSIPHKPGFFSSLFKRKNNDELQGSLDDALSSQQEVTDELRESLQQLIDQLSAMDHYREVGLKLTEKLAELNAMGELVEILELITSAFVEVSSLEHQQFETFLKTLSKRIDRVNGFVASTVSYSEKVSADSKELDTDVRSQVSALKNSFDDSLDIDNIKVELFLKMDSITAKVGQFYHKQELDQQVLTHEVQKLQDQLRATGDESVRLREELAAQRIRAQTDPLTQLPNRYSYNERLTQEYNRWRRYRSPLSLVVCDIDHFKKVNDQYGHDNGDELLKKVANFLQSALRESDFIARFGGEEFVILLPETPLIDATKAMNKLRLGVKSTQVSIEKKIVSVSLSFGISEFENDDTPKAVFSRADKALYRAKDKGRDQVCCQRAISREN